MLVCVRWYAAYPLSLRQLEEMMAERGVSVDHDTAHCWALKMLPVLAAVFRQRQRPVQGSWRMDETCILVGGKWKYLLWVVDRLGQTLDFLRTARRDVAAVRVLVEDSGLLMELRQSKYLNNIVEQDHRAIKRRLRPMLGLKTFHT